MNRSHHNASRFGVGLLMALGVLGAAPGVRAADDPVAVMQGTVNRVLAVLRNPDLQPVAKRPDRIAALRVIADEVFDWEDMARRSLGVRWRAIDEAQRARFVAVFKDLLANHYMKSFDNFQGDETVDVHGMRPLEGDRVVSTTIHTHGGETIPIEYTMGLRDGTWKIYDVTIEGVSLVNHYRKSFGRVLVNGEFSDLMAKLERKHRAIMERNAQRSGP